MNVIERILAGTFAKSEIDRREKFKLVCKESVTETGFVMVHKVNHIDIVHDGDVDDDDLYSSGALIYSSL